MPVSTFLIHRLFLSAVLFLTLFAGQPCRAAESLRVGLLPEYNIFHQARQYKALLSLLSEKTGITLSLHIQANAGLLEKRLADGTLDAAFIEAHSAARLLRQHLIIPVAGPLYLDGSSQGHSTIITLTGSPIRTPADTVGKSFALVDQSHATGYLYPLAWLRENGIRGPEKVVFTGSLDGTITAVLDGAADLGATSSTVYDLFTKEHPEARDRLRTIATSPPLPPVIFCVRAAVAPAIRNQLHKTMLSLHLDPANEPMLNNLNLLGFIAADPGGFNLVLELAARAAAADELPPAPDQP